MSDKSDLFRILVIFNPHAAAGRSGRLLPEIRAAMASRSIVAEFRMTAHHGHAEELVRQARLAEFDALVAAGGDGTLFEVLNGLYAKRPDARVPLGLLPVGTGNAFARDLELEPGDWAQAIDLIAARNTRRIDVGQVRAGGTSYHFLNVVGMGLAVDAGLAARRLKFLGNAAYTAGTLWQVIGLRSYAVSLEVDGRRLSEESVMLLVSNSRYTGTRFLVAPHAILDDGLLDVTLVRPLTRRRLLRLFPTIYTGRHVDFDEVLTLRARQLRVLSPEGMPLAPDGEFKGETPVEFRCLPRDLELLG